MFEAKWISFYFFALSALIQFGLFVVEGFILSKKSSSDYPAIFSFFSLHESDLVGPKNFLTITSHFHLLLSILTVVGLRYVLKLQPFIAGPISSMACFFTIYIGIIYLTRSKNLWKVAAIQIIPMILGFLFLLSHILPAIRGTPVIE